MRNAFIVGANGRVVSAVIPKTARSRAFLVGHLVTFAAGIDLGEAEIPPRSTATVVSHCPVTGHVWLEMTPAVRGMRHWEQMVLLVPFETEELLEAINGDSNLFAALLELSSVCMIDT